MLDLSKIEQKIGGTASKLAPVTINRAPLQLFSRRPVTIGDGIKTDMVGATRAGLDALFVTGGIHRSLHKETPESPADPVELQRLYEENDVWPVAAVPLLRP